MFYEWNVFELFERKVVAVGRADDYISDKHRASRGIDPAEQVVPLRRWRALPPYPCRMTRIDYVFTDPPFGSNLFYADMALFQEGWLDAFTDVTQEAVIDRSRGTSRSSDRYEHLLTDALRECVRVSKAGWSRLHGVRQQLGQGVGAGAASSRGSRPPDRA